VVVLSRRASGLPAQLPVSYVVPGTGARTHVLVDLGGAVDVATSVVGGDTRVTLSAVGAFTPSPAGIVSFVK